MKVIGIASILAATAAAGTIGAPTAFADTAPTAQSQAQSQTLGNQGKLVDGAVVQGWTVTDLKPSADVLSYPVYGTLWEATATDKAIQGSATPIVSNFNARAADGQSYRVLFGAATPQGVNPSTLAEGQETSGKVYSDVTGAAPDSVVYNAGGQDLLVWVPAPPSTPSSSGSSATSYGSGSSAWQSPVTAAPAAPASRAPAATPPATAQPAGSQGTPIPAGSQGTPIAPGQTAPATAGTPATPQPAGSQGTPLPADNQVPTPTIYAPTR